MGGDEVTSEELDRLEALATAATRSPWHARDRHLSLVPDNTGMGATLPTNHIGVMTERDDAAFIAAARTAVPKLIAECRRLRVFESIQLAHDQDHCKDCGVLLVPCTCQPDCPGSMCANCREVDALKYELAAMTAARDEACDYWESHLSGLEKLRAVGGEKEKT